MRRILPSVSSDIALPSAASFSDPQLWNAEELAWSFKVAPAPSDMSPRSLAKVTGRFQTLGKQGPTIRRSGSIEQGYMYLPTYTAIGQMLQSRWAVHALMTVLSMSPMSHSITSCTVQWG